MNNLKQIRELYGATQEQVASAINVNRVTVANWESSNSIASSSNQERLSIYYGIGPEYFYEKELDETAHQILLNTAAKAREKVNISPYPNLIPATSAKGEKYVRSAPDEYTHDDLLDLPRV